MLDQNSKIYVPYPYALEGNNIGGLASVIDAERKSSNAAMDRLTFITSDSHSGVIKGVNVINAEAEKPEEAGKPMSRRMWHTWCTMFHEAYTDAACPNAALQRMYKGEYKNEGYGIEKLAEHINRYGPTEESVAAFHKRYQPALQNIEPGSVVNFQDFVWFAAIRDLAPSLKENGCTLKGYGHTVFPDNLDQSLEGRRILQSISLLDDFYAHADVFTERLERQLLKLNLPVPNMHRFDLGIDLELIDLSLKTVSASNFQQTIPGFNMLPESQREFIKELFKAQNTIPHNFMCVDRIDPVKGLDTVIEGIEDFLDKRLANGESPEDLRNKYRFFFLNLPVTQGLNDPYNLSYQYASWLDEKFKAFTERPELQGIVFRGDPVQGEQRIAFPAMMQNMNMISGGRVEGLHLSFMEAMYVNRSRPIAGVLPLGAGFAQHANTSGYGDEAIFPVPNDFNIYSSALTSIVNRQSNKPENLATFNQKVVDELILPRRSSVLFD